MRPRRLICALLLLAACLAAAAPCLRAAEFDDELSAGLYLEKHGDYAGAYLRYAAARGSKEAGERMAGLSARAAAGLARVYQVLPFISRHTAAEGRWAAAELQKRLAADARSGQYLRAAAMDDMAPAGFAGPASGGGVRRQPGVNRFIVGELEKVAVTARTDREQELREVKEPYEETRMEKEEYQVEVDEDEELDADVARLMGDGAAKKKAGKTVKKKPRKGEAPRKKLVTRTREVPRTYTEYRVRYEPRTQFVKRKTAVVTLRYGVVDPVTGNVEFIKRRTYSGSSSGPGGKAPGDDAVIAKALSRAVAAMAGDLAPEVQAAAAGSAGRVKDLIALGKKKEAAAECLRLLGRNGRDPAALQGLSLLATPPGKPEAAPPARAAAKPAKTAAKQPKKKADKAPAAKPQPESVSPEIDQSAAGGAAPAEELPPGSPGEEEFPGE